MEYEDNVGAYHSSNFIRANSKTSSSAEIEREYNLKRFGSTSSQTSQTSGDICRICHCESDTLNPLLTPCYCSGSLKYVHQQCLQQWLTASETNSCELCKFPFIMHTKIKPFNEWRSLEMSGVERRRLFCAVLFHFAAAVCVIWSLCVLIERAAEEVSGGKIGWPFWTKLVVVTVGLTGGIVFMYIQCKQYLNLCTRWRARNRILLIQNVPEKIVLHPPHSPLTQSLVAQQVLSTSVSINAHANLRRNNSSILVITAPLNNIMEQQPHQIQSEHHYGSTNILQNQQLLQDHHQQHSGEQIIANIENNSINYELDDDISYSQISFKHHLRQEENTSSRGSMHNVYDNTSISTSISTQTKNANLHEFAATCQENDSNLLKMSLSTAECEAEDSAYDVVNDRRRLSNASNNTNNSFYTTEESRKARQAAPQSLSSVFLENRDILNDQNYPKLYYRHSSILLPTTARISRSIDEGERVQKDLRRYSDTKLLNQFHMENEILLSRKKDVDDVLGSPTPKTANTNFNELFFEHCDENFDPLELNIQKVLELDIKQRQGTLSKMSKRSLDNVLLEPLTDTKLDNKDEGKIINSNRTLFKSLPNLKADSLTA